MTKRLSAVGRHEYEVACLMALRQWRAAVAANQNALDIEERELKLWLEGKGDGRRPKGARAVASDIIKSIERWFAEQDAKEIASVDSANEFLLREHARLVEKKEKRPGIFSVANATQMDYVYQRMLERGLVKTDSTSKEDGR